MLSLFIGRAGTGKSHRIMKLIDEALSKGEERLILIVPEQYTLQGEIDLIDRMHLDGIINFEILSFNRLVEKALTDEGRPDVTEIGDLGKAMLLKRLFQSHQTELSVFGKAFDKSGFINEFARFISEMKRGNLSPDAFAEIRENIEDPFTFNKLKDIQLIYSDYETGLEDKFMDGEDKYSLLMDKMDGWQNLKGATIWIDGFDGFTEQEYLIIEKLNVICSDVTIALTYDPREEIYDHQLFNGTRRAYNRLIKGAQNAGAKYMVETFETSYKEREISHLANNLFAYPYERYERKPENIHLLYAANPYEEVETVAIEIMRLMRDSDLQWKDIMLVTSSAETYNVNVKRVFDEYGIPVFLDEKNQIINNPIVKVILSALNCMAYGYRHEDVFRFVKTGFTKLQREEVEFMENYCLSYGIRGQKWFSVFEKGEQAPLAEIFRKKLIGPFEEIKTRMQRTDTVEQHTRNLYGFLQEIELLDQIQVWVDRLAEENLMVAVNENVQIWNIIVDVLDQLVEIIGQDRMDLKSYIKILEEGFKEYKVGIIPPTRDNVLVGTLDRTKSHEVKVLFFLGVNEGLLPSKIEEGKILSEEEILLLKNSGFNLNTDTASVYDNEQFSIYEAMMKSNQQLYFSYALSDVESKALRPSIFIDKIIRIFPDCEKQAYLLSENRSVSLLTTAKPSYKYLVENFRQMVDGAEVSEGWIDVYKWYEEKDDFQPKLAGLLDGLFYDNGLKTIGKTAAKALYETPIFSSVSRLERYTECPFRHFVKYGMKPSPRNEYKLNLPDIGTVFHNTIETFGNQLEKEDWRGMNRADCDRMVDEIVDNITIDYGHDVFQSTERYKYLINKIKRVGKRAAWTLSEHIRNGNFDPMAHELVFSKHGEEASVPPILIELSDGTTMMLEGRIDRIDVLETESKKYVKVIDYKSGNAAFDLSNVYNGLQMQLMVYMDAVLTNSRYFRVDDLYPAGVFYFKIDDPLVPSSEVDGETIEKEIKRALKMDGLFVDDLQVISAMDVDVLESGKSDILPVEIKSDNTFSKNSQVISEEGFMNLILHVRHLIKDIGDEIISGTTIAEPYRSGARTACDYCEYGAICQFDGNLADNNYRDIKKLKDEEILERIAQESKEVE